MPLPTAPLLLLLLVVLVGCASGDGADVGSAPPGSQPPSPAPSTSSTPADPVAGEWVLGTGTVDGQPLPVGPEPVTLTIGGDAVAGSAGCNTYRASLTPGSGTAITLGPVSATRMACTEDVMVLERPYLAALDRVTSAAVEGGTLVLSGDGVELRYDPS